MTDAIHAMTDDEIEAAAELAYTEVTDDPRFWKPVFDAGVPTELVRNIFRVGFMCGGEAATQRIQDYVDAGGVLEKSK